MLYFKFQCYIILEKDFVQYVQKYLVDLCNLTVGTDIYVLSKRKAVNYELFKNIGEQY